MAIYVDENIPAVSKKWKDVTKQISFEGLKLDEAQGDIKVISVHRQVDPSTLNPVLDSNGNEIYKGCADVIEEDLMSQMGVVIDGISGMQVFEWLAKWVDSKKHYQGEC